jgi:membrane-associated phospholipid phosphatase
MRAFYWGLLICAVLVAVSVGFVDRPMARLAHDDIGRTALFLDLTRIPEVLAALSVPLVVVLGLVRMQRGRLAGLVRMGFLAGLSMIVAEAVKNALKLAFGRTWPETWVNHNPSFIDSGVYGFFPFHGGAGWGSFPSGHMTIVTAAMGVFWVLWPRWRGIYLLPVVATAVGLFAMDYHFVGDMIGGSFLGFAVAVATVRIATVPAVARVPVIRSPGDQAS